MTPIQEDYEDVRHRIRAGDVIAFGGRGIIPWIIKRWTNYPCSHVGIVTRCQVQGVAGESVRVMESTRLNGYTGVVETRLSKRVRQYDGEVWLLQLANHIRRGLDLKKFWKFIYAAEGRPYDLWQAIRSPGSIDCSEDGRKYFCSELVAAGLEAGGVIDNINSAAVTPEDVCKFRLYAPIVIQIKGASCDLPLHNTLDPDDFG